MCNTFRNEWLHLCVVMKIYAQYIIQNINTTEVKGNWNEQKGKLKQLKVTSGH